MADISKNSNILIVEDQVEWVKNIKRELPADFSFESASTLEQARAALRQQPFDLIIADLVLSHDSTPFADLGRLIFAIKQEHIHASLHPPIIIVTGYPIEHKVINDHGGWIWGWHVKSEIGDGEEFRRNVQAALATRKEIEKGVKTAHLKEIKDELDPSKLSIGKILASLTTTQLWTVLVAICSVLIGGASAAYYIGTISMQP